LLIFERHLSCFQLLPCFPLCMQLLASLFRAATLHHLLLAGGEGERRIMGRHEQERERVRDNSWQVWSCTCQLVPSPTAWRRPCRRSLSVGKLLLRLLCFSHSKWSSEWVASEVQTLFVTA
jgi:hypothetical protein